MPAWSRQKTFFALWWAMECSSGKFEVLRQALGNGGAQDLISRLRFFSAELYGMHQQYSAKHSQRQEQVLAVLSCGMHSCSGSDLRQRMLQEAMEVKTSNCGFLWI